MKRIAVLLLVLPAIGQDDAKPWFGISMTVESNVPEVGGKKFKQGIRVYDVIAESPAQKASLKRGDIVVAVEGIDFGVDAQELLTVFRAGIEKHKPGDTIKVTLVRDGVDRQARLDGKELNDPDAWADPDTFVAKRPPGTELKLSAKRVQQVIEVSVVLDKRPAQIGGIKPIPPNEKIFQFEASADERLARELVTHYKLDEDLKDILKRLAQTHERADAFRLSRMAYAHRDPFKLPQVAHKLIDDLNVPLTRIVSAASAWLDAPIDVPSVELKTGLSLEEHVDQLLKIMDDARADYAKALPPQDLEFVRKNLDALTSVFLDRFLIDQDDNAERRERNLKLIEIAGRADMKQIFRGAARLACVADPKFLEALRADLTKSWEAKGKPDGIFFEKNTPLGKVFISGPGRTWYREDAALIIDLGGNDLYTNNAGSSRPDIPVALLIDFGGDDAYEASFDWTAGTGCAGLGMLIDWEGNDSYIGQRWAQGTCALGVGILWDRAGNDTYRATEFAQGAALWGFAALIDDAGDDRYVSTRYGQAVGLPGGLGLLRDAKGRDEYYCKGRYQTEYGDRGIFEGWGQGCGVGFRGRASGGIGVLIDLEGDDTYEAGNFSQGGGYYFGAGFLYDRAGNDKYIGSRYNQGFSAHQAIGFFEDVAGDDFYTTRQGVAQGLAWDESVTVFIDDAGNDRYEGGFFSQGASAHNSIAIFIDRAGRDTYLYPAGQALSGPNDYHGGKSLSFFFDLEGDDTYDSKTKNSEVRHTQNGIVVDLPNPSADWKKFAKD